MSLANAAHQEVASVPPEAEQWRLEQTVQAEGSPPDDEVKFLMPDFDPRKRLNGAPPIYQGPMARDRVYGQEDPVIIEDRNGQEMAQFPPGTIVHRVSQNQPLSEIYPDPDDPQAQNTSLRSSFFSTPDGSEAAVFKVTLAPQPMGKGFRFLVPHDEQVLIVSVDRQQFSGRENIPFPEEGIWTTEERADLVQDENLRLPIYYDLLRIGDSVCVARTAPVSSPEGRVDYQTQVVAWNTESSQWRLVKSSLPRTIGPTDIKMLSNGTLLASGTRFDYVNSRRNTEFDASEYGMYSTYSLAQDGDEYELTALWQFMSRFGQDDFVISPDGRGLFMVDQKYIDASLLEQGRGQPRAIYFSPGSEPGEKPAIDESTRMPWRDETQNIAELPLDFSNEPRITISPDGSMVAVVSQYSNTDTLTIEGETMIPDYRTIHGESGEHQITAAMLTVVKRGQDGQWHSHHIGLPEGWGMTGRFLLSWEPDGNLRISQYDDSLPEEERWSYHFIDTSILENGLLREETFFVEPNTWGSSTDSESSIDRGNIQFKNGVLMMTDTNGVRREFIVGVQPEGVMRDFMWTLRKTNSNQSFFFTFDNDTQTLNYGVTKFSLGFTGDQISGAADPLVGVVYKGSEEIDQMSRPDRAAVNRQTQLRQLFGAFRNPQPQ